MMEDPRNITPCTHLLFMAKNLERIGDHATNIAENVYFLVHGQQIAQIRRKGDSTATTSITPPAVLRNQATAGAVFGAMRSRSLSHGRS